MVVGFMINVLCAIVSCAPNLGLPGEDVTPRRLFSRTSSPDISLSTTNLLELPIVQTSLGSVEGYFMKTVSGKAIYAFEGIPFAEAPVGQRRFRPPVPKKPWKGLRPAKSSAPYCLQMHTFFLNRIMGIEDCLQLNVYTTRLPQKNESLNLPVLVFIHGGSFQFGGAIEHGPAYLLERDVVLVTINYRLGILGFLSTGDEASPGNNGLKDQALAIEWVYNNVEQFGGDRKKLTLIGESAGAASVHLHLLSPGPTRNYVQRAIAMSASAFNFWAVQPRDIQQHWTSMAANFARCPKDDSQALVRCLRSKNPVRLVSNEFKMIDYFPSFPSVMFSPVVEPELPGAFLTESPEEIYKKNQTLPVPFIISNVESEGEVMIIALPALLLFTPMVRNWRKMAPIMFDYKNMKGVNKDEITGAIENYYFKNETDPMKVPMSEFGDITTDRYFSTGIYKALKHHSKIAPTYSSVFNYRGRFGLATAFGVGSEGRKYRVGHTEDLFYVFNMTMFSKGLKLSDPEYKIAKFMVDSIVDFAESGNPNAPNSNSTAWKPIDGENIKQLVINEESSMEAYPKSSVDAIDFWDSLNLTATISNQIS